MSRKSKAVKKAMRKTMRIIFIIVAVILTVIAGVCLGFGISWFADGVNTTAAVVLIIVGLIAAFIVFKIIVKIKDSIFYERHPEALKGGSSSVPQFNPVANRTVGSDGELKKEIRNALPSGSYYGSWSHGDVYIDSINADISTNGRSVRINGTLRFTYTASGSEADVGYDMRDKLNDIANSLSERVLEAIVNYTNYHSGFDGNWRVSTGGLRAQLTGK